MKKHRRFHGESEDDYCNRRLREQYEENKKNELIENIIYGSMLAFLGFCFLAMGATLIYAIFTWIGDLF